MRHEHKYTPSLACCRRRLPSRMRLIKGRAGRSPGEGADRFSGLSYLSNMYVRDLKDTIQGGMDYQVAIAPDGKRRFCYVSSGVMLNHGITPEQACADPSLLYNQIYHEDRIRLFDAEVKAFAEKSELNIIIRSIRPDGDLRWLMLRSYPRLMDDGTWIWNGIEIDVTEQMHMEEALRNYANEMQNLMKNMANAFVVWGMIFDESDNLRDIRFEYFNDAYEKVSGLKLASAQGRTIREIWPDTEESWYAVYRDVALTGIAASFEMYHVSTQGWYACNAYRPGQSREKICCVFEDITEKRKAEEERVRLQAQLMQAAKMEVIGRLAGGMAHDFNNLLTAIIGNIELVRLHAEGNEAITLCLDEADKATHSAVTLTQQLLAFARKQIIEPRLINLNDMINERLKMLSRLISENIFLKVCTKSEPVVVKGDPGQLEQVLINLVVNARDSMPDGGELKIEANNTELDESFSHHHSGVAPGRYALLSVSDTGYGMTEEVISHIFEPFYTTKALGTGLGLATVYGIVKQADGWIDVKSEIGNGSVFNIYLPSAEAPPEILEKEDKTITPASGTETILVVEDEDSVRSVAVTILNRLGYTVLSSACGNQALDIARNHTGKIDLLLTDVVMPGMNGRELSESVTRLHPEIKTLFTSGYTEDIIAHHGE